MKAFETGWRAAGALVIATVAGSLLLAQGAPDGKAVRGTPIQPLAPAPRAGVAPSPGPAPAAAAAVPAGPAVAGDYLAVGFDKLAGFKYEVPEYTGTNQPPAPNTNQIPAMVREFNDRRIALKGFMLPLKVEQGKVTEMLLMRDQSMCCFGAVPKINEFVTVKMTGAGTRAVMDQAVTLYGRLKVGEFSENGYLLGIYRLEGEKADGPGM